MSGYRFRLSPFFLNERTSEKFSARMSFARLSYLIRTIKTDRSPIRLHKNKISF